MPDFPSPTAAITPASIWGYSTRELTDALQSIGNATLGNQTVDSGQTLNINVSSFGPFVHVIIIADSSLGGVVELSEDSGGTWFTVHDFSTQGLYADVWTSSNSLRIRNTGVASHNYATEIQQFLNMPSI